MISPSFGVWNWTVFGWIGSAALRYLGNSNYHSLRILGEDYRLFAAIVGLDLRFFDFLARSICSWVQCTRQLNRYVRFVSCFGSNILHCSLTAMSHHDCRSESVDRNAVNRHLGATISMWDVHYHPVDISTDHALIFFHPYFRTFSCFKTTSVSQNESNRPDRA